MSMLQAGGYGKVITHVIIGLKTVKGTKQLKLDPTIYDSLQKEKVLPGDVIYIEANSGKPLDLMSKSSKASRVGDVVAGSHVHSA